METEGRSFLSIVLDLLIGVAFLLAVQGWYESSAKRSRTVVLEYLARSSYGMSDAFKFGGSVWWLR